MLHTCSWKRVSREACTFESWRRRRSAVVWRWNDRRWPRRSAACCIRTVRARFATRRSISCCLAVLSFSFLRLVLFGLPCSVFLLLLVTCQRISAMKTGTLEAWIESLQFFQEDVANGLVRRHLAAANTTERFFLNALIAATVAVRVLVITPWQQCEHHQWIVCCRRIGLVTMKVIYSHKPKNMFTGSKYPKTVVFNCANTFTEHHVPTCTHEHYEPNLDRWQLSWDRVEKSDRM